MLCKSGQMAMMTIDITDTKVNVDLQDIGHEGNADYMVTEILAVWFYILA